MEDTIKIRKDKIKNVALIFLSVMLILTFFSNSILNRALPEVATAYVAYNTITEKVRGNGVVTADDPYKVVVKDTRTIESVAVKVGDEVTKDQVLFYLEDAESEELKKAKDELEDLELAYMKAMFGSNLSSDVINKVANGKEDSFATYQAKVTDMQNRLQAAEDRVKECEKALETLSTEGSVNNNDASVDTIPDELEKADAATDLANAEAEFNANKAKQVANINAQITEVQNDGLFYNNKENRTSVSSFKPSLYSRIISYTGIQGYYNPFTAEAQYNPGLPSTYLPFTLAHEHAHQLGFAREQEANFIAFLTGKNSSDADLKYSTQYFVLKSLLNALAESDPGFVKDILRNYSPAMQRDRTAELSFRKKHEGWLEEFFGITNDLFLKSNRQEGAVTYSYFVNLLVRFETANRTKS